MGEDRLIRVKVAGSEWIKPDYRRSKKMQSSGMAKYQDWQNMLKTNLPGCLKLSIQNVLCVGIIHIIYPHNNSNWSNLH